MPKPPGAISGGRRSRRSGCSRRGGAETAEAGVTGTRGQTPGRELNGRAAGSELWLSMSSGRAVEKGCRGNPSEATATDDRIEGGRERNETPAAGAACSTRPPDMFYFQFVFCLGDGQKSHIK